MLLRLYKYIIYLFLFINLIKCSKKINKNKIIISITNQQENIQNTYKIIKSIIDQNVNKDLYQILLILSLKEYKTKSELPNNILLLENSNEIKILLTKRKITNQTKLIVAIKEYPNNPILIINNKCSLPNGWLDMFIKDYNKYPNDAIVANVQYFFGKNGEIKEFSEGFRGKFGIFNHVTEIIFNFALINTNLGGILYPKNYFNNPLFFDENLFLKVTENSDEFWQSAFIIIEDKVLRQSSTIFDYTRYLINNDSYEKYNKRTFFEKIKLPYRTNLTFVLIQLSFIKKMFLS